MCLLYYNEIIHLRYLQRRQNDVSESPYVCGFKSETRSRALCQHLETRVHEQTDDGLVHSPGRGGIQWEGDEEREANGGGLLSQMVWPLQTSDTKVEL